MQADVGALSRMLTKKLENLSPGSTVVVCGSSSRVLLSTPDELALWQAPPVDLDVQWIGADLVSPRASFLGGTSPSRDDSPPAIEMVQVKRDYLGTKVSVHMYDEAVFHRLAGLRESTTIVLRNSPGRARLRVPGLSGVESQPYLRHLSFGVDGEWSKYEMVARPVIDGELFLQPHQAMYLTGTVTSNNTASFEIEQERMISTMLPYLGEEPVPTIAHLLKASGWPYVPARLIAKLESMVERLA